MDHDAGYVAGVVGAVVGAVVGVVNVGDEGEFGVDGKGECQRGSSQRRAVKGDNVTRIFFPRFRAERSCQKGNKYSPRTTVWKDLTSHWSLKGCQAWCRTRRTET